MHTPHTVAALLTDCFDAQHKATAAWHVAEPPAHEPAPIVTDAPDAVADAALLHRLVLAQHLMNFRLWHVEDTARRTDVGPDVIAECKRTIDGLNQRRNDYMEKVDACLVALLRPLLPAPAPGERPRHNTESLGMAVDRLSILSLKVFHMEEQAERADAAPDHRERCAAKLAVLREQRADLAQAVL
ncbi:MAG TPA: hypothetical protein DEV75_06640, partial [Desulfovibrio sp.]|nr:hypothetical protein [Desulfovibrio sp.]